MTTDALGEPAHTTGLAHGPLPPTLMGVMPAAGPRPRIFRQAVGGKDILPHPEPAGTGVFAFQCKWSGDWGDPVSDILRMEALDAREMFLEGGDQTGAQQGHPIIQAFAIPRHELLLGEIK